MSTASPLVSVVIDNYNYGRFLSDAIDSVLNQTYSNIEVIVVDDGSVDNSREVIASYGARVIPVLKENGGQASAFNAGFAASKGDIVCFLDSDDIWLPKKLERVVSTSVQRPDAVFIYHGYRHADAHLNPVGKSLPLSFLDGEVKRKVLQAGGCWPFPPPSAFAFRRSLLESYMPIPEEPFRLCADACLAYVSPLIGPIAAIREPLCFYRLHGSNAYAGLVNKEPRDAYELRAMRYRANVEATNQLLARLGRPERFQLQDHTSYIFAKYFAGAEGRRSWMSVSWKLARTSSEPSWFVRFKDVIKFWLEAVGARQPS